VRHSGDLIDKFDSEELGDGTILPVISGQFAKVEGPYSEETPLGQFYPYTVEGSFRKPPEYRYIQYDPIYGSPTRMDGRHTRAIEVVNFRLLPPGYQPEANP
jgi:hypothetical protein